MDLVENNIPVLHSLSPEWVQKIYAKESLIVPNVKILSIFFSEVVEAKSVKFSKNFFDYVKCPHLMNVQIPFSLLKSAFLMA